MSYVRNRTIIKIARNAAFCALIAMMLPVPVLAQLKDVKQTGSHLRAPTKTLSTEQVRTLQHDFAVCVVKQDHDLASQYVLDRDSAAFPSKYRGLLDPDCLFKSKAVGASDDTVGMTMNDPRLVLADALIAAEAGQITADRVASATSPKAMTVDPTLYQAKAGTSAERLSELQKNQAKVEARIRLCLDKGVEIAFSEEVLRGVVAYNFYVLGHQPPAPQTAGSTQR